MTKTSKSLFAALQAADENTLQFTAAIRATGVTPATLIKTVENNPDLFVSFMKPGMAFGACHLRLAAK